MGKLRADELENIDAIVKVRVSLNELAEALDGQKAQLDIERDCLVFFGSSLSHLSDFDL